MVQLEITDMSIHGEGIGKVDGYPLFVKDAIIGDVILCKIIKEKKNYGYGKLMEIITPSKDRVPAVCPVARSCGGCQLQELSYQEQLAFKKNKVAHDLKTIGHLDGAPIHDVIGMEYPFRYRNKAQVPVGRNKHGDIVMGFYAGRTHAIIEAEDCMLGPEENQKILQIIRGYMQDNRIAPYDEKTCTGCIRHVLIRKGFHSGEIMVCIVINSDVLPKSDELVQRLLSVPGMTDISYSVNKKNTNVILGTEIVSLYGQGYITDEISGVKFQISPLSFFQVNPVQTERLYETALRYTGLTGQETVWDLYCGTGTISLFLAQAAKKVYGVEIIPQAIENARANARLNNIDNVEFFVGKSEEVLPDYYEKHGGHADVIVVDPPRKGCDEVLLQTIAKMQPERVVYVSCDCATLARDLHYMAAHGYEVVEVQPVDMFPMSVHVESVCLLHRRDS